MELIEAALEQSYPKKTDRFKGHLEKLAQMRYPNILATIIQHYKDAWPLNWPKYLQAMRNFTDYRVFGEALKAVNQDPVPVIVPYVADVKDKALFAHISRLRVNLSSLVVPSSKLSRNVVHLPRGSLKMTPIRVISLLRTLVLFVYNIPYFRTRDYKRHFNLSDPASITPTQYELALLVWVRRANPGAACHRFWIKESKY